MQRRCFEFITGYEFSGLKLPQRATKFSAGYDIFNNTGMYITIPPKSTSDAIPTFLKADMHDDEVLTIYVRSSHGFKYNLRLSNSSAIIDKDYYGNSKNEGHIFLKFLNSGDKEVIIAPGEAMAQGIFTKYLTIDGDLSESIRDGGIGSTDKN